MAYAGWGTKLSLGELTDQVQLSQDGHNREQFYEVRLDRISADDNLILNVVTSDPLSDPDIFISFTVETPKNANQADITCASVGKDICTISSATLHEFMSSSSHSNEDNRSLVIYIGVVCKNKCKYQIQPTIQKIITLQDSVEMQLDFEALESKLFKVRIPSEGELGGLDSDRVTSLTIMAAPLVQSAFSNQRDLVLAATTVPGKTPGSSDLIGGPVWTQGTAIHLCEHSTAKSFGESYSSVANPEKQKQLWCTDCWVSILLSVRQKGRYSIISKADVGPAQQIYEGKPVYGLAQNGEKVCYKYHIKNGTYTLDVKYKFYSGVASQTISPVKKPMEYEDAEFKRRGGVDSHMKITSEMRTSTKTGNHSTGFYYICVFAHTPSSYQIIAKETDPTERFQLLENGFEVNDYIINLQNDSNKNTYIYQVPRKNFAEEEVKIAFDLQVQEGPMPRMAVRLCNLNQKVQIEKDAILECGKDISNFSLDEITRRSSSSSDQIKFLWGKLSHGAPHLQLEVDHDEGLCKLDCTSSTKQNLFCFYQIVVLNDSTLSKDSKLATNYSISVIKIQNNYQIMRSFKPIFSRVQKNELRYFKYTLPTEERVLKVSIQLNILHGDCNLYVTRDQQLILHPNMESFRQVSPNRVDYEKGNGALAGDYYIVVEGYQQSSFELVAKLLHTEESDWELVYAYSIDAEFVLLTEDYYSQGEMLENSGLDEEKKYRFTVNMIKGFEKDIKLTVKNADSSYNVKVLIGYQRLPTETDKDFYLQGSGDKYLDIKVGSPHHHLQGTYYIRVTPQPTTVQSFQKYLRDEWFKFSIKYTLDGNFEYLVPGSLSKQKNRPNALKVFRYIVEDPSKEIKLNLNSYKGSIVSKYAFDINQARKVSRENRDGVILQSGESQQFSIAVENIDISKDGMCLDELPCIMFFAVWCIEAKEECDYTVKVRDANDGSEQILIGTPLSDSVQGGQYNYYHIRVSEKHLKTEKPIFLVLNTLKGETDLYVKWQTNSDLISKNDWSLPTLQQYDAKSTNSLIQKVLKLPTTSLQLCIETSKQDKLFNQTDIFNVGSNDAECALIVGVLGAFEYEVNQYDLVVYVNIQRLVADKTAHGTVQENEYQYFLFDVSCDDCEVLFGLQTFSGERPDMYLNFGEEKLPEKEAYTFKSTSSENEIFQLNLKNDFFRKQKLTSMKGTISIGVYGKKQSTFLLTASQNEHPIVKLVEGVQIKNTQKEYHTSLFKWKNIEQENQMDDIKIEVQVTRGKVDLYVNTYNQVTELVTINEKIPNSKQRSIYFRQNINPLSQLGESEIIISSGDQDYCLQCLYLIGVHSHEMTSDYEVKISLVSADFNNSHFVKMGAPQRAQVKTGQRGIFMFIFDEKAELRINQANFAGETKTYLSQDVTIDQYFDSFKQDGTFILDPNSDRFQTAHMLYIIVENTGTNLTADFTLLITQDQQIIEVTDGVPLKVKFEDDQDVSKNFAVRLPYKDGNTNSTITLQIQSYQSYVNSQFEPYVYYKQIKNFSESKNQIVFPPNGNSGFKIKRTYEGKGFLQVTYKVIAESSDEAIAFSIYMQPDRRNPKDRGSHEVIVFASASREQLLAQGQEYLITMFHGEKVKYMKLDQSFTNQKVGYTVIEYTNCLGNQNLDFLANSEDFKSQVPILQTDIHDKNNHKLLFFKNPIPKESFYAIAQAVSYTDGKISFRDGEGQRSQFMIKAFNSETLYDEQEQYIPSNNYVSFKRSETSGNIISLSWQPILDHTGTDPKSLSSENVEYIIFLTNDLEANLQSPCSMNNDVVSANQYQRFRTKEVEYDVGLRLNFKYKINVVAEITKPTSQGKSSNKQINSNKQSKANTKSKFIHPYDEFTVEIQKDDLIGKNLQQERQFEYKILIIAMFSLLSLIAFIYLFMNWRNNHLCRDFCSKICRRKQLKDIKYVEDVSAQELGEYKQPESFSPTTDEGNSSTIYLDQK